MEMLCSSYIIIKRNRSEMIVRPIFVTLDISKIFEFWVFETMSPGQQDIRQNFLS